MNDFFASLPGFLEWYEKFKESDLANLSPHCGHIFKPGELLYRCQDCGVDDTCVICMKCWQPEDHVGHLYGYTVSEGSGGSCDCGERESWKNTLSCPSHAAQCTPDVQATGILNLNLNLTPMVELLVQHDARVCEDDINLPLVLYNDERHSFDQVIRVLSSVGYTRAHAADIANQVDRLVKLSL